MVNLTFGEQVKLILGRKGMTIKQLAELVEERTGKPMSRQNMTQRLGRDNFQEQDMRLIADILGCKFQLSIMENTVDMAPEISESAKVQVEVQDEPVGATVESEELHPLEREITIGELADMADEVAGLETANLETVPEVVDENESTEIIAAGNEERETFVVEAIQEEKVEPEQNHESEERALLRKGLKGYFKKSSSAKPETENTGDVKSETSKLDSVGIAGQSTEEVPIVGDINPYTGKEYKTNSVRMHPKRIGYVQVYDQEQHKWTDMTEWAFLGYQERKKVLLGKDYEPPIYLD